MSDQALAPRDHNEAPDQAQIVTDRLAADYAALSDAVEALIATDMPEAVTDASDLDAISAHVATLRDKDKDVKALRIAEKEPFLRGGQAVDQFFNDISYRLLKTMEALSDRVTVYKRRQLAEERARRAAEEAEARRAQEAASARLRAAAEAAEEAERAAARARKPEHIEAHKEVALDQNHIAEVARIDTIMATDAVHEATLATLAKPADIVRERTQSGRLVTMKQIGHAEIVNVDLLDLTTLRPFIKEEHLLMAVKAWAKQTGFKKQMPGALVEMREVSDIR